MKTMVQKILAVLTAGTLFLSGCGQKDMPAADSGSVAETTSKWGDATDIILSDEGITVDGAAVSADASAAVYAANDIVYYEAGKDFTYGEGSEADAHSAEEAASHTVVHITQPGRYVLSGTLSAGQVAVDLGDDAEEDPEAVVSLILNGVDITCTVAPAVIFYNVYECGSTDTGNASKDVDTSGAGANVIIADGTTNTVNGSYVARIYKPESVELNEDSTEVADAKKLHKYDAAFYSKMSMNIGGESAVSETSRWGTLYINAENEGLDSELHLTLNGGIINIISGNDGINTNEDGVSVTTINDGSLSITVTGETGEGDGIDSNGWLVINGGEVMAYACGSSMDSGIDSDMGIHVNGGTVVASGNMLDLIEEGGQNYAVFQFAQPQSGGNSYDLRAENNTMALSVSVPNAFSILLLSAEGMEEGDYTLWQGDTQLAGSSGSMMGGPGIGGMMPQGFDPSQMPEMPGGMPPGGFEPPAGMAFPEGMNPGQRPEGQGGWQDFPMGEMPDGTDFNPENMMPGGRPGGFGAQQFGGEASKLFRIVNGGNMFHGVTEQA